MSKESGHSSCKGRRSAGSESPQPCPAPESLTVENVQRLERQYETDGRYSPEKAVEEYIRRHTCTAHSREPRVGGPSSGRKRGSQGSAEAQSLSEAIPVGIVKASDGSCDAAVGGYDVSGASAYKFQVSDPNQSGAPSSTSHKKITSPGSGSKCTSPEDIGAQAHDSRECAAVCPKTQTDMDWNWQQKTEPDDGNVMKEESQPDCTDLEIQELENEIQGLVASPSFECEDVRSEKLVEDGLYLFPDVGPPSVLAYHPESKQLPPGYDPMKTISYRLSAMKSLDQEDMFPAAEEQSDIFAIVSRGQKKLKDPSLLRKPSLDVHCPEHKDKTLQIYDILEKIWNAVEYPHRSQTEKTPFQYNLTVQIQRPEEKAAKKHKLHPSTKVAIKQNHA